MNTITNTLNKWLPGETPATPNANLQLLVRAILILAIIFAASQGGLEENLAALVLSRLP